MAETHHNDGQDLIVTLQSKDYISTVLLLLDITHQIDGVLVEEKSFIKVFRLQQNSCQLSVIFLIHANITEHLSTKNGNRARFLHIT